MHGFERYFGSSIKGQAEIDWGDEAARRAFLQGIVPDADRLLEMSRQRLMELPDDSEGRQHILAAAELLAQLLCQDIDRGGDDAIRAAVVIDNHGNRGLLGKSWEWIWGNGGVSIHQFGARDISKMSKVTLDAEGLDT